MGLILKIKGPRYAEIGEGEVNTTDKVRWQRMCTFRNTCAYCAQFHGVIHDKDGKVPRLYLHQNCECSDIPILPEERFAKTPSFNEWTQESSEEELEQMFGKTLGRLVKTGKVQARDITHRDGWDSLTNTVKDYGISKKTLAGLDINKATISRIMPVTPKISVAPLPKVAIKPTKPIKPKPTEGGLQGRIGRVDEIAKLANQKQGKEAADIWADFYKKRWNVEFDYGRTVSKAKLDMMHSTAKALEYAPEKVTFFLKSENGLQSIHFAGPQGYDIASCGGDKLVIRPRILKTKATLPIKGDQTLGGTREVLIHESGHGIFFKINRAAIRGTGAKKLQAQKLAIKRTKIFTRPRWNVTAEGEVMGYKPKVFRPTNYSRVNVEEDFAECFAHYILDPAKARSNLGNAICDFFDEAASFFK